MVKRLTEVFHEYKCSWRLEGVGTRLQYIGLDLQLGCGVYDLAEAWREKVSDHSQGPAVEKGLKRTHGMVPGYVPASRRLVHLGMVVQKMATCTGQTAYCSLCFCRASLPLERNSCVSVNTVHEAGGGEPARPAGNIL